MSSSRAFGDGAWLHDPEELSPTSKGLRVWCKRPHTGLFRPSVNVPKPDLREHNNSAIILESILQTGVFHPTRVGTRCQHLLSLGLQGPQRHPFFPHPPQSMGGLGTHGTRIDEESQQNALWFRCSLSLSVIPAGKEYFCSLIVSFAEGKISQMTMCTLHRRKGPVWQCFSIPWDCGLLNWNYEIV